MGVEFWPAFAGTLAALLAVAGAAAMVARLWVGSAGEIQDASEPSLPQAETCSLPLCGLLRDAPGETVMKPYIPSKESPMRQLTQGTLRCPLDPDTQICRANPVTPEQLAVLEKVAGSLPESYLNRG